MLKFCRQTYHNLVSLYVMGNIIYIKRTQVCLNVLMHNQINIFVSFSIYQLIAAQTQTPHLCPKMRNVTLTLFSRQLVFPWNEELDWHFVDSKLCANRSVIQTSNPSLEINDETKIKFKYLVLGRKPANCFCCDRREQYFFFFGLP